MGDSCCCPPEAGNATCELPKQNLHPLPDNTNACPVCGEKGKPVEGQTVKALLSLSLRNVQDIGYLFCKTPNCPVVYYAPGGEQKFTIEEVRERVYQKEPDSEDVFVCYCFRHTVKDILSSMESTDLVDNINAGIKAGQCACDLRNPQGSCCLGNVSKLIKNNRQASLPVIHQSENLT